MKILAIGAHPDDIEIGCGGTLARLISEGAEVEVIVGSRGEAGSLTIPAKKLADTREKEARESAKVLGVTKIQFLGLEDGLAHFERSDKIKLIKLIREIKPEVLFVHTHHDSNPDHRLVHELAMAAATGSAGPWFQEAGGEPHRIDFIYGYEVWNPLNRWQYVSDITQFLDKKVKALTCHQSQIKEIDYVGAVKGLAGYRGALCGEGRLAEVFEVIKTH